MTDPVYVTDALIAEELTRLAVDGDAKVWERERFPRETADLRRVRIHSVCPRM